MDRSGLGHEPRRGIEVVEVVRSAERVNECGESSRPRRSSPAFAGRLTFGVRMPVNRLDVGNIAPDPRSPINVPNPCLPDWTSPEQDDYPPAACAVPILAVLL